MTLHNQVALVTGGSRGIGKSIALTLARRGAHVVINYRQDYQAAEETASVIKSLGRQTLALQADVSQAEQAQSLIDQVVETFQRLDILINSVGPFLMKPLIETSVVEWQAMIESNLGSAFYCTQAALPIMRKQKSGNIIYLGSPKADSLRARQNAAAYGIAKTGVLLLAKTVAREEGPFGIKANVVNPGIIDTGTLSETELAEMATQIALRQVAAPQVIADAVYYLLSPEGRYCNGTVINVDGGLWL